MSTLDGCPLKILLTRTVPQCFLDVAHLGTLLSMSPILGHSANKFTGFTTFSKQVCTCPQFRFDHITCVLQHRSTRVLHVTSLHASRCTSKTVSASLCEAGSTSLIRGRSSFTTHISLFLSPTIRRLMLVEGSIQGLEK